MTTKVEGNLNLNGPLQPALILRPKSPGALDSHVIHWGGKSYRVTVLHDGNPLRTQLPEWQELERAHLLPLLQKIGRVGFQNAIVSDGKSSFDKVELSSEPVFCKQAIDFVESKFRAALPPEQPKPFEGPKGIPNVGGNDCCFNALAQMAVSIPTLANRLPEPLKVFRDVYNATDKIVDRNVLNSQDLRRVLMPNQNSNRQEDATEMLSRIFPDLPNLVTVSMPTKKQPFAHKIANSSDINIGADEYFVQIKRFGYSPKGPFKITTRADVKPTIDLFGANYHCDAFLVHRGQTVASGHYVAYKFQNGLWCECNDAIVREINDKELQEALSQGYFYHFAK